MIEQMYIKLNEMKVGEIIEINPSDLSLWQAARNRFTKEKSKKHFEISETKIIRAMNLVKYNLLDNALNQTKPKKL